MAGEKRKAASSKGSGSKKQKKSWWRKSGGAKAGFAGFLVTSHVGKERKAAKEVCDIASRYIECASDAANIAQDTHSSLDTLQNIRDEIRAAKASKAPVSAIPSLQGRGFHYVSVNSGDNPVDILRNFMNDVLSGAKLLGGDAIPSSRHCVRMFPLQATCFPSAEGIASAARPFLEREIADGSARTFAIRVKSRMKSNDISRMDIINAIVPLVGEKLKADLTHPDIAIYVDVCKSVAGVSVVSKPAELHDFNIQKVQGGKIDI